MRITMCRQSVRRCSRLRATFRCPGKDRAARCPFRAFAMFCGVICVIAAWSGFSVGISSWRTLRFTTSFCMCCGSCIVTGLLNTTCVCDITSGSGRLAFSNSACLLALCAGGVGVVRCLTKWWAFSSCFDFSCHGDVSRPPWERR